MPYSRHCPAPAPASRDRWKQRYEWQFRRTIDDCEVSEVAPVNDIPYHEHPPRRGAECA